MRKLFYISIILTTLFSTILGTFYLAPSSNSKFSNIEDQFQDSYTSVCEVHTGVGVGSGVLLESGYILTAGHNIDRNNNNKIDDDEKIINARFHAIDFETQLETIALVYSHRVGAKTEIDIALCRPSEKVPLKGVRLYASESYWQDIKIGTLIHAIGMTNGVTPANITDGRITTYQRDDNLHRNSASTYFGNSGGGVFTSDGRLAGIVVRVGTGHIAVKTPIVNTRNRAIVGQSLSYIYVPIANSSLHISAPAINNFLIDAGFEDALKIRPQPKILMMYLFIVSYNTIILSISILLFFVSRAFVSLN